MIWYVRVIHVISSKPKNSAYVEAEIAPAGVSTEEIYESLNEALCALIFNGKSVDPSFAVYPKQGDVMITHPRQVSSNLAVLAKHFVVTKKGRGKVEMYKVQTRWKKDKNGPDEWASPKLVLSFKIGVDSDPEEVVNTLSFEWGRKGGTWMAIKSLQAYSAVTGAVLHRFYNNVPLPVVCDEFKMILDEARTICMEIEAMEGMEDVDDIPSWDEVPALSAKLSLPYIPGQNGQQFEKNGQFKADWIQQEGNPCGGG